MYLLARMGHARDWGNGIELNSHLLGKNSTLDVHHIFPKKVLYDAGHNKSMVNQLANYAFLTKETNLEISDKFPADYLPGYVAAYPGAVESHAVPTDDPALWELGSYEAFLARRRELLAEKANAILSALYEGEDLGELPAAPKQPGAVSVLDHGDEALSGLSDWLAERGYERGAANFGACSMSKTVIVDLAWPDGLQTGLGEPVALMVDSGPEERSFVTKLGYHVFETPEDLMAFVENDEA